MAGKKRMQITEDIELCVEDFRSAAGMDQRFPGLTEDDRKKLSKVKKKVAPHMWVLSKDSSGSYMVTIGDPRKSSSTIKQRFSGKSGKGDMKSWVGYEVGKTLSPDHVIDLTGMKLVPEYYSQWYVDNMM